jgi:uncharacterized protein YktA (UPF0223 family)
MEYQYPFDTGWNTQEVVDVIRFFEAIELAYEKGIHREKLMEKYKRFKEIVPGKADEKKYCNEFEEESGYSSYHVIKKMKELQPGKVIKM